MPTKTTPMPKPARTHRLFRWVVVLVLALTLIPWGTVKLGQWIVISDAPMPARAIVVMSGEVLFRAMEAAALYHEHLAPEIWLTRTHPSGEEIAFRRLRLPWTPDEIVTTAELKNLGVPSGSIRILNRPIRNTEEEIRLIAEELGRLQAEQVILVTSKYHTRRVKTIWQTVIGTKPRAIVRFAYEDPYDPGHWWRDGHDVFQALRENLGLLNVWAGFPVRPQPRQ